MTEWADIASLYRYWQDSPPVHELVAGAVGFKAPTRIGSSSEPGITADEARQMIGKGAPITSGGL